MGSLPARMSTASEPQAQALVDRLKHGDPRSMEELVGRYGRHLIAFVRKRLPRDIQARVDPEDITQDVFAHVAKCLAHGVFRCNNDQHLFGLLCGWALKRLYEEERNQHRARRSPICEVSQSTLAHREEPADTHGGPEGEVIALDLFCALTDGLEPEECLIGYMLLVEGYCVNEAARALEKPRSTIQGILEKVKQSPHCRGLVRNS